MGTILSVFVSQDPVAIDSVGADFLINEPVVTDRNGALKDNPNVENYLHEAGLVGDAPSGNVYQNGNEKLLRILEYMNIGTILLKRCIAVIWGRMKALSLLA